MFLTDVLTVLRLSALFTHPCRVQFIWTGVCRLETLSKDFVRGPDSEFQCLRPAVSALCLSLHAPPTPVSRAWEAAGKLLDR